MLSFSYRTIRNSFRRHRYHLIWWMTKFLIPRNKGKLLNQSFHILKKCHSPHRNLFPITFDKGKWKKQNMKWPFWESTHDLVLSHIKCNFIESQLANQVWNLNWIMNFHRNIYYLLLFSFNQLHIRCRLVDMILSCIKKTYRISFMFESCYISRTWLGHNHLLILKLYFMVYYFLLLWTSDCTNHVVCVCRGFLRRKSFQPLY